MCSLPPQLALASAPEYSTASTALFPTLLLPTLEEYLLFLSLGFQVTGTATSPDALESMCKVVLK